MFGFNGHPQFSQLFEGNGQTVGASRFFGIGYTAPTTLIKKERIIFDTDDVGADPPQMYTTSLGPATYDGRETFLSSVVTAAEFQGSVNGANVLTGINFAFYNNNYIGYNYNSAAVLTPATRKWKWVVNRPEFLSGIVISVINGGSSNAAANVINHPTTFNTRAFQNLKYFSIGVGYFGNKVTIIPNTRLENVNIVSGSITGITGTLPPTVKTVNIGAVVTSVNNLISGLTACESLTFGYPAGGYNGLVGPTTSLSSAINISHMTNLKIFTLPQNNSLASLILPTGNTGWIWFHTFGASSGVRSSITSTALNSILASPTLKIFYFSQNQYTWSKNITNSDIATGLTAYDTDFNSITGSINITASRPNLRQFNIGNVTRTGSQQNLHSQVNITGLTGARNLFLAGCDIDNLELPINTVCTSLYLFSNKLAIATNPNIISRVNGMTALVDLRFGNATGLAGQNSTGLGANPVLTGLTALQNLYFDACKITGTLSLSNTPLFNNIVCGYNTGLTAINSGVKIRAITYTQTQINLDYTAPAILNNIISIVGGDSSQTVVNLSGRTITTAFSNFVFNYTTLTPTLTTIHLPVLSGSCVFGTNGIGISKASGLATFTNLSNVSFSAHGTNANAFNVTETALNTTFPIGTNGFIPRQISLNSNGMSQANVDATINNMYTNRTKWSVYSAAKTLNIAGTNSTPSGTYQAPAGFVLGSNDGTPASAKEQIYVLVNNYAWSITYT